MSLGSPINVQALLKHAVRRYTAGILFYNIPVSYEPTPITSVQTISNMLLTVYKQE